MRRTLTCLLVLAVCGTAAAAARRDVNRDGRVDMKDVRALARMAAGLDPADLDCDQNGDGVLTIEDVNILLALVRGQASGPATPTPAPAAPAGTAASGTAGGRQFLVVEQAADGKIVVAVGAAGIKPGDRVLGVYTTFAAAEAERLRLAGGAAPAPPQPPPTPTPVPTPTPIPTPPAPATPELAGVVAAVPVGAGRTLLVAPGWRAGWLLSPIGDGSRANLVRQNLGPLARWQGRFATACALYSVPRRAEELFVFLPELAQGRVFRGLWRPTLTEVVVSFSTAIRGRARSVLPLARHGNDGRTAGVYLYHWPTGTALYAPRPGMGSRLVPSRHVNGFPLEAHEPVVLPVESREGATRSFVVIEPVTGAVWLVLDVRPHRYKPRGVRAGIDLATFADLGRAGGLKLAAAPLYGADRHTSSALVVDETSGRLAVIENDDDPARIRLRPLAATVNGLLPSGPAPRRLMVLPLGRPGGALVLDAASGRLVRVVPGAGGEAAVKPVTVLP